MLKDIKESLVDQDAETSNERLERMDLNLTKLKSQNVANHIKTRPLLRLGFGVTSFFELLEYLILFFFIATLLSIPQMYLYESGQGYGGD